jgi:hypothetical protein
MYTLSSLVRLQLNAPSRAWSRPVPTIAMHALELNMWRLQCLTLRTRKSSGFAKVVTVTERWLLISLLTSRPSILDRKARTSLPLCRTDSETWLASRSVEAAGGVTQRPAAEVCPKTPLRTDEVKVFISQPNPWRRQRMEENSAHSSSCHHVEIGCQTSGSGRFTTREKIFR